MEAKKHYINPEAEIDSLKLQLEEANDMIDAIRNGEIDALVIKNLAGHQLYTLKTADQTYRVFIENMNEGAITLNNGGLILYCNSSFARMIGKQLSKVIGLPFWDFVADDQKQIVIEVMQKAWAGEIKGELTLKNGEMEGTAVLFSITTLELDEGMAMSIILTDLSTQKAIERQLKQKNAELEQTKIALVNLNNDLEQKVKDRTKELFVSREHFRFLADNIPVMTWTASPNGRITYFNKRWYEYTGLPEGESNFEHWIDAVHPEEQQLSLSRWQESMKTGQPYRIEYRIRKAAEGIYRWHFGNALPYITNKGEVLAWFGIATDIDFQKKALEQKDEFISMVSHELKTPVTSLKGFAQLARMTLNFDTEPIVHGYLATMDVQINKLIRLIADLLQATAFNNGMLTFEEETFDFNQLVTEVKNELQLTAEKHEIRLRLAEPVNIYADKNRVGQVVSNLVSNAIKYSPNGHEVIVSTERKNGEVICCVRDFGIGISKEQQQKLFTRFFRVQKNNVNTFPGMGLGLYISMGIIEKHHGRMWVESEEQQGAAFYFSLPVAN